MSPQHTTPFAILAAVDYSDTASLVVDQAVEFGRYRRSVRLHFLHVNQAPPDAADQEARHAELLEWLSARLNHGGMPIDTKVSAYELSGEPAKLIVETARDLSIDTVVVGTHGRTGLQRLLLGSVAASVVKSCSCAVLVVRPKLHDDPAVQIEPPCPECLRTRSQSKGEAFWCEQHAQKHGRRHTYYDPRASSWVTQRITP